MSKNNETLKTGETKTSPTEASSKNGTTQQKQKQQQRRKPKPTDKTRTAKQQNEVAEGRNPTAPTTHPRTKSNNRPQKNNGGTQAEEQERKESSLQSQSPSKNIRRRRQQKQQPKNPLKYVSLGGLGEIGKNIGVFEYANDMFIVDCGLAFPDDDMPGVDIVLPDFTYLLQNRDKIRGIALTHGHEDHIGGVAYLLKEIDIPVYGTRLTLGLLEGKLKEQGINSKGKLNVVLPGDTVKMGCMSVEFIAVNHSIPDACALAINTPVGVIVHTGDFKIDYTPVDGQMINLARLGELGRRGVLMLMCDSTNAERPGPTPSERRVGESFEKLFAKAAGKRIVIASFSSNVHRIQQVINVAVKFGRKVVVSGRSMENVVSIAMELGYLKVPDGTLVDVDAMRRYPDEKIVIISTGSQGEPMSALTRMARGDHRKITVTNSDFIIISATPIPGNEKLVGRLINELMKLGAEVMYESALGIHVSGHACREEIKAILALVRPKFYLPVHGEYKHLVKNAEIAVEMGMSDSNILVTEIGKVVEIYPDELKVVTSVPTGAVMVDGSGVGDVGNVVLRDRRMLGDNGLMVVSVVMDKSGKLLSEPDIISRGFVYVRESDELMAGVRKLCKEIVADSGADKREWSNVRQQLRERVGGYLYSKTKRRPMILPMVQVVATK